MPSSSRSVPPTDGALRFKEEAKSLDNYVKPVLEGLAAGLFPSAVSAIASPAEISNAPRSGFGGRPGR